MYSYRVHYGAILNKTARIASISIQHEIISDSGIYTITYSYVSYSTSSSCRRKASMQGVISNNFNKGGAPGAMTVSVWPICSNAHIFKDGDMII